MANVGKRNYHSGKIYCIRNYVDDDIYIGSSCQPLSKRMAWHRDARKRDRTKHLLMYQKMNTIGIEKFYIELIENYPCHSKEELLKREGEVIRDMKPVMNSRIEGRTSKERYIDQIEERKEGFKIYYQNNKDTIKQKNQTYHQENKEAISKKRGVQISCDCGGCYTLRHKARHLKTAIHQNYLNNNIEKNVQIPEQEQEVSTTSKSST